MPYDKSGKKIKNPTKGQVKAYEASKRTSKPKGGTKSKSKKLAY